MLSYPTVALMFLLTSIVGLELLVPYTKVEESFNMQASHDLLSWRWNLAKYDHNEFPGVVPRTFLGSLFLAALVAPFKSISHALGNGGPFWLIEQHLVRCSLGLVLSTSVWILAKALPVGARAEHERASAALMTMAAVIYHVSFYGSRTLPNTFAMILVNCAVALLFQKRVRCGFALLAACAAVFRSDVLVFVAPLALIHVFGYRHITLGAGAAVGILGAVTGLLLSAPLDSLLWGKPLWPELSVLLFNTVENRSSEWGVSPFHWYFTSAIPKAFMLLTPLMLVGPLSTGCCRDAFIAAFGFVLLYSILPHKEVRFIMVVFPTLACPAACAVGSWVGRRWGLAIGTVFVTLIAGQGCIIAFQGYVSSYNYPGAEALSVVHSGLGGPHEGAQTVYLDAYAGMTGVTRFVKGHSGGRVQWVYNKDPTLFNKTAGVYEENRIFDKLVVRYEDREWHGRRGLYEWVADVNTVTGRNLRSASVITEPFLSIWRRRVPHRSSGDNM